MPLVDPQGHLYSVGPIDTGRFQPALIVSLPTGGCSIVPLCSSHTGQPLSFVQRRHAVRFTVLHARRAHRLAAQVSAEQAEQLFEQEMEHQPRPERVCAVNLSQGRTPVGV